MSTLSPARSPLAPAEDDVPRRPHDTVLYGLVREHLATFLAHTERSYTAPLPQYVVDTVQAHKARAVPTAQPPIFPRAGA
jgi:hypothetical protein